MISQNRRKYSSATGRVAEVRFIRAAKQLGFQVTKGSRKDDMHLHIDYWLAHSGDSTWGVDVKGNNLPDEIWCEFKNVAGNPGWMYGGAEIIAFDMPEEGGFSVVQREELKDYCEKTVEDVFVSNKKDAYKKKYTRKDRADVITKLNLLDIKLLDSYRVWDYSKEF
jgi:hypothetical protein